MKNNNQHIPSGYKASPLGIIPEDWEVKRLGEVCNKITDGTHDTPQKQATGVPYLTAIHIKDGAIDYDGCYFLSQKDHQAIYKRCDPEYGDVLMVNIGAGIGSAAMNRVNYEFSLKNVALLKPSKELLIGYFLESYLLMSKKHNIYKSLNGGAQPFWGLDDIAKILIAFPSIKEQKRICSIFQLWDTAIAKQTALIEKLTLRKRGLMQQLLTGKKRLKGFSGEWKEVRLGEVCPMERGEMLTSDNYLQGDIPVIAGGKEPAGFHSYANRQKNTITISCSGASAGFVAFHDVPIFATDCFTISESNAYNIWFIYHVLTNLQEKIYKLQTGGAQPHVHPKDVYPMKIHIPSIKEQNAIASVLVNADKEIETQKQKLTAMQAQKKGLMQVLLTGKKRVK